MGARIAYKQPQAGLLGPARDRMVCGGVSIPLLATDLTVVGAQTALFRVPAGFTILGWLGPAIPKLDSGATLTFSIGDAGSPNRLLNASAVGQAGGALPAIQAGALYYQYPVDTDILMTIVAAAAGLQAGAALQIFLDGFVGP